MIEHTSVRVALGLMVAGMLLFGGVGSASACSDLLDCDGDADLDTDEEKEDVYVSHGASGSAELSDLGNASTEHEADLQVNTGYLDSEANGSIALP